ERLRVELILERLVVSWLTHVAGAHEPDGGFAAMRGEEFADGNLELERVAVGPFNARIRVGRRQCLFRVSRGGTGGEQKREDERHRNQEQQPQGVDLEACALFVRE